MILDTVGTTFDKLKTKGLAAPAVLTRTTHGAHNSATGTPAAGTTTNCNCLAVRSADAKGLGFLFGESLVQGGDEKALVPAKGLTFDPLPGDTLTMGGVPWVVIASQATYAGAVPVMFSLLVRK